MSSWYSFEEAEESLRAWDAVMQEWNDNKSHEIDDNYIKNIKTYCTRLKQLGEQVQMQVNQIADEVESL